LRKLQKLVLGYLLFNCSYWNILSDKTKHFNDIRTLFFWQREIFLLKKQIKNIYTENVHLNANIWISFLFKKRTAKDEIGQIEKRMSGNEFII